jgi:phosphoglucosamine mutase
MNPSTAVVNQQEAQILLKLDQLFGTDGIRTRVGEYPLTFDGLTLLAKALAQWICMQYGPKPRILIAGDTRNSYSWIKATLVSGLLTEMIHVVDAGILPTPAVALLVRECMFDCGIVISASHNLYHDNGIKIIDRFMGKLLPEHEKTIIQCMREQLTTGRHTMPRMFGVSESWVNAGNRYQQELCKRFDINLCKGLLIVIDSAHGALSAIARNVFELFGANVKLIHASPDGININALCGALHPEALRNAVLSCGADVGFAFDGDGDRIVVVNRYGECISGDQIIALLSTHSAYRDQQKIVGTVVSNHGLAKYCELNNKYLLRVPVGDKYIVQELMREELLLGGEPSGHIILRDYLDVSDGLYAALRIVEVMNHTGNVDLVSFIPMPQIVINVPVVQKRDLGQTVFVDIIQYYEEQLKRVDGKLVVRYSGTELLLRVTAQGLCQETTQKIAQECAHKLSEMLR